MPETFTKWDPLEYLTTDDDLRRYLAAAAEDAGDGNLIRAALKDIVRSGNFAGLLGAVGISRQSLDQALDQDGNPSFTTIARAITALGMQIQITPAGHAPAPASADTARPPPISPYGHMHRHSGSPNRHSGASRNLRPTPVCPVIPATPPVIPATPPVIPAPPTRHSGASRNLRPAIDSGFRRNDGKIAPPNRKRRPAGQRG